MKKNLVLISYLFTITVFGQPTIKFVQANSDSIAPHFFGEVFENINTQVFFWNANKDGYLKIKVLKINPSATYHLANSIVKYKPIWKEIDINSNDTLTVFVEKNDYYIEKSEDLYFSLCSFPFMSGHDPKAIRSLKELPDNINSKVSKYLKDRLGENFLKKFKFINGQIVNLKRLKKVNSGWKNSMSEYKLCFAYRNLNAGINMYASKIELDSAGNILKDLKFPIIKSKSVQKNIFSLKDIKNRVIKDGFFNSIDTTFWRNKNIKTEIKIDFDSDQNILIWKLKNRTYHQNHTFSDEERIYNGHNGNYIKTNFNNGTWSVN